MKHGLQCFSGCARQASFVRYWLGGGITHHLLIAYVGGAPAGFVTGVELIHPDKPKPEMFLYELGVDEPFRGRGVATALLQRLVELCRERGCGSMFVLTDEDNAAARATYTKAGGEAEPAGIMFVWTFA